MNHDRRRFLGVLAGVAVGGAGVTALFRSTRASAGATFRASDVSVTSDDGSLRAATVAPTGTVSWSGLEEPAGSVSLTLYAKLPADLQYHELASQHLRASGLHGETDYAFETRNLLNSKGFSAEHFDPDDGKTLTRPIKLRLAVTVYGGDGETTLTTGYADATFVVTVENLPEDADADGEANTGAETPTENGDGEKDGKDDDGGEGGNDDGGENGDNEGKNGDDEGENGDEDDEKDGKDDEEGDNGDDGEEKNEGNDGTDDETETTTTTGE